MARCEHCGTHTGTHWPDCPQEQFYSRGFTTIKQRIPSEKQAYIAGLEAGIELARKLGLDTAAEVVKLHKETMEEYGL